MQQDSLIKKVQIKAIINETKDAKTFVLQPLDGWQPVCEAGQFITLLFNTKHGEKRRSYSFSSSPAADDFLCITIKKVDNGEFSRQMIYKTKVGDVLYTSGIGGLFKLPENGNEIKQYFFLAAGSGITPCFSLIKTLFATTNCNVVLIYSNKSREETIFYEQLKSLAKQYKERLTVRFLFSDVENVYHRRLSHWLLQQLLKQYLLFSVKQVMFYTCGPFEYMQTVTITLLGESVPSTHIIKENFNMLPRSTVPKPPNIEAHDVTINITNQIHKITVQYPQTILAAAKTNHITLPYSCEAGRCGSCVATCISGKIWMAYNEVLLDDEVTKGRVLTCQSFPLTNNVEIVF